LCGIAGILDLSRSTAPDGLRRAVLAMSDTLVHRGPDDAGHWIDAESGVALGHRRLSILDLSPTGRQPMLSADQRYVIVFNGEIYNHQELRGELIARGMNFRGRSDTEAIVNGCMAWGVRDTIARLNGMFALAIWDAADRVLTLARDHVGIKPLYWGKLGSLVLFGSELKALRAHPGWAPEIDPGAVAALFHYQYVLGPGCIYRGIQKLEPGHLVEVTQDGEIHSHCYWRLADACRDGRENRLDCDDGAAVEQLDGLLRAAVRSQMESDVPLGAFLSGGIDSSTVVALMQSQSNRAIRTFSIGFDEKEYNEAQHARAVAKHLGTDHTELYVTPRDALDLIPRLSEHYDEPFGDSSQIPTLLLSKLTRQHVTVSLSGDGGDELFQGYDRYARAIQLQHMLGAVPARKLISRSICAVPSSLLRRIDAALPARLRALRLPSKVAYAGLLFGFPDVDAIYDHLVAHWQDVQSIVPAAPTPLSVVARMDRSIVDFPERARAVDVATYLPDDILTKVDRASMAHSLEARVPLLDRRVVEFAWRLPERLLVRDGQAKWLLRQVLYRYVPRGLVDRPKMGFGIPIDRWLRGPLRDWAEALLAPAALARGGLIDPRPIRKAWDEFLQARRNLHHLLWDVLMFQDWRARWDVAGS
jgi:asparagine synthase (glutamine-hydrolysing)